jgi:hypothetical protein
MNEHLIVTIYTVIDDLLRTWNYQDHCLVQMSAAEVLTVAVVAAHSFQNHHERTLCLMHQLGYVSGKLSVSRFNRRLHALADWLVGILGVLGEIFGQGEVFILDSLPVPVCRRVHARRCRKVRGREYCGYCDAKKEKFFGWRLHLVCTPEGLPVAFDLLPAAFHDLTPVHELTFRLPWGACVYTDKAYNSADDELSILTETGVRLIPVRRKNMKNQHRWADEYDLRLYRHTIETFNSQLEKMGLERLYARTNAGFDLKVHASLLALAFTNLH